MNACAVKRTLAAMSFDESAVGEEAAALVGVPAVEALEALGVDGAADAEELAAVGTGGVVGSALDAAEMGDEAAVPRALGWLTAVQPDSMARQIIAAAKAVRRSPTRATVREQGRATLVIHRVNPQVSQAPMRDLGPCSR